MPAIGWPYSGLERRPVPHAFVRSHPNRSPGSVKHATRSSTTVPAQLLRSASCTSRSGFSTAKNKRNRVAPQSPCHDEIVRYEVAKSSNDSGKVSITAYKIVSGRPVKMGSVDWKYNREERTLVWETPMGVWKLVFERNRIYGELTQHDKNIFRRVTLKKDEWLFISSVPLGH